MYSIEFIEFVTSAPVFSTNNYGFNSEIQSFEERVVAIVCILESFSTTPYRCMRNFLPSLREEAKDHKYELDMAYDSFVRGTSQYQ